jgi:exoribonuclease R
LAVVVTRLVRASRIDFTALRRELELPTRFPPAALREADESTVRVRSGPSGPDRTDIGFVTIDPPTSRDLDQAVFLARRPRGYRVHYAIADVTAFVPVGGRLERETWRRGQTVYLPDARVPLHPPVIAEGAGSLLPDQTRPAALWTIDLDRDGATVATRLERAMVRSRARYDYDGVQEAARTGRLDDAIALLPEIGRLLIERGLARGAMNLPIPEQEVEPDGDGGWRLALRAPIAAEAWNAQISLLTGACAATIMLDGGLGLLRTMPAPGRPAVERLRAAARALGIGWPRGATPGRVVSTLDPGRPRHAAFIDHAAELMRGARYTAFDGDRPADAVHGAVAVPYAHVTAPLRRLADRYATEVCLSLVGGHDVPTWAREALPRLPAVMEASDRRASRAERAAIDLAEAVVLADRVGEEFDAVVVDVDDDGTSGIVALVDPPVVARCRGRVPRGERVKVRLTVADPARRLVSFEAA